ncbi:phosphatidylglycerophosphatase A [Desulfocurvibacter africanus]|uniref:phosphatidylglycerophosphatase A family protein n=1 Tax=Desulfocurvibacter africanus TaxID=873 RepID=UPI0003FDB89A|nr:phosphatidylglycerophosphatase A [Desulfocurvibacter africanus]
MADSSKLQARVLPMTMLDKAAYALATLWPLGHAPKAPGTAGALFAALLAPWLFMPLPTWGRLAVLAMVFVLGGLAATRVERVTGRKDPGCVIVDELLGQWVTYLPFAQLEFWQLLVGFSLFRLFDITKPWPVCRSETCMPDGFGIMIDDAVAALYAAACLWLVVSLEAWLFI